MALAQAAHMPVIWPTQVLENSAKTDLDCAEISDAAIAARAQCVMLSPSPQIVLTAQVLDDVLRCIHAYPRKRASLLKPLRLAREFYREI
jgi:pyruvate kinase